MTTTEFDDIYITPYATPVGELTEEQIYYIVFNTTIAEPCWCTFGINDEWLLFWGGGGLCLGGVNDDEDSFTSFKWDADKEYEDNVECIAGQIYEYFQKM